MTTPRITVRFGGIIALAAFAVAASAQNATDSAQGLPEAAERKATAGDVRVDEILTRLEERDVPDLRSRVTWVVQYVVEEEPLRKMGRIWYKRKQPVPVFKVQFDTKIVGSRKEKDFGETHLFDGRWYTEMNSETKTITQRELRRETDTSNPYRLGEGAFPLPFGQKKADILREFDVRRIESKKGDPEETDHIELHPKKDSSLYDTYEMIEFWVERSGKNAGLPIQMRASKLDPTGTVNSRITVTFSDVELNSGFADTEFRVEPPPGYDAQMIPLDEPPRDADRD